MEHAPNRRKVGRSDVVLVRQEQGKVASGLPRIVVVSENSIADIHTDMGVPLEKMRLVPVASTPTCSSRCPAWLACPVA